MIAKEFQRHRYLLEEDVLFEEEKEDYFKILCKEARLGLLQSSVLKLTEWLHRYHEEPVIVLIDEYDTPVHAAYVGAYYVGAYYDPLISFLRNWLSGGVKDNSHIHKGMITGILRIAKESIFSGVNNISHFTVLTAL